MHADCQHNLPCEEDGTIGDPTGICWLDLRQVFIIDRAPDSSGSSHTLIRHGSSAGTLKKKLNTQISVRKALVTLPVNLPRVDLQKHRAAGRAWDATLCRVLCASHCMESTATPEDEPRQSSSVIPPGRCDGTAFCTIRCRARTPRFPERDISREQRALPAFLCGS